MGDPKFEQAGDRLFFCVGVFHADMVMVTLQLPALIRRLRAGDRKVICGKDNSR